MKAVHTFNRLSETCFRKDCWMVVQSFAKQRIAKKSKIFELTAFIARGAFTVYTYIALYVLAIGQFFYFVFFEGFYLNQVNVC